VSIDERSERAICSDSGSPFGYPARCANAFVFMIQVESMRAFVCALLYRRCHCPIHAIQIQVYLIRPDRRSTVHFGTTATTIEYITIAIKPVKAPTMPPTIDEAKTDPQPPPTRNPTDGLVNVW
jgi:hypothetical protein